MWMKADLGLSSCTHLVPEILSHLWNQSQFFGPNWIYLGDSVLSLIDPTIAGTGSVARDAGVDYFAIWN